MPHQTAMLRGIYAAFRDGRRCVVGQLPTGAGKTPVAATAIRDAAVARGRRCVFVTHRVILARQGHETFTAMGMRVGLVAEGMSTDPGAPVQVVNMGTITSGSWPAPVLTENDLLVVDEGHRNDAARLVQQCRAPRKLIFTATPSGEDGAGLGLVAGADHLVHGPPFRELEAAGILTPVRFYSRDIAPDALQGEVNRAMSQSSVLAGFLDDLLARPRMKTVIFSPSIEHCDMLTRAILDRGARARAVHSELQDRDDAMASFERGDVDYLVNSQVLCEGWNFPPLMRVAIARRVGSVATYLQMVGRVVRPWCFTCSARTRTTCRHEGHNVKTHGEVLDYGSNWLIHGHPTMDRTWSISSGSAEQTRKVASHGVWRCGACFACDEKPHRVCPYCGSRQPMRTIRLARGCMREYVEHDPEVLEASKHAENERKRRGALHRRVTGILLHAGRGPGARAGAEAKRIIAQFRGDEGAVMKAVSLLLEGK